MYIYEEEIINQVLNVSQCHLCANTEFKKKDNV